MSEHTPGPWTTEHAPHRAWICRVGNNDNDPDIWSERIYQDGESYIFGDKSADAALIAAAPDLLEALRYARRFVDEKSADIAFIDAAIAKATAPQPAREGE